MAQNQQVTIKDIAVALGMSHSTVSRALNGRTQISEKTRAQVREAAARLGYIPNLSARLIRGDAGLQVGLLIPDVQNDFFSHIAKVLSDRCRKAGLRLLLGITDNDPATEESEVRGLLEARVGGVLTTLSSAPTQATLDLLKTTICVQLTARNAAIPGTAIGMADTQGSHDATAHLLALGHRKIAYLGPSNTSSIGRDRLKGYRLAHKQAGVVPFANAVELVQPRRDQGLSGATRLIGAGGDAPTAMVVASPELALGALKAIKDAGLRIPEDISVVGYGDPRWFELLSPPLTTVRLPVERLAEEAARTLFEQLGARAGGGERQGRMKCLPTELVVRGSTAKPAEGESATRVHANTAKARV